MANIMTEKIKLIVALLVLQCCYAGFHIVSRLALNIGISRVVYPIYRDIIALLLLSPFAYFLEKNNERPPLTLRLLAQFFLLALIGITANQSFYLLGIYYASPTFASAMQNSVPAITFVLASALGLEEVNISRRDGLAKVLGTIACVGGATIITLYKGPLLLQQKAHQIQGDTFEVDQSSTKNQNWTLGCLCLLGHCLCWAGWMVFQAPVVKKYPAKLTLTSFTCLFGLIQFLIIAAFTERDLESWKIQSKEELLTILYAGVISSGIVIYLQTWCIQKGGPVFVAVFQPLQTFIVAIMAALILGDKLYSGGYAEILFTINGIFAIFIICL
ncbi:PREDICTED: WAT1-related protein At3g18200-like [Lupinus angustifolius]|uniref:WAT1-related protein At3g18200-like n=1 Tax=Lupinus angustifolius TaxID=3871 RepID=UPI00092EED78|nr:PREDICTED: WAT1-related protein At3g18200-like [Lupinus angustifolius]